MRCANFRHNMFLQCGSKSSAIDTAPLDTHSCLGQTAGQPQLPLRSVDFFIVFCFVFPFPSLALLFSFFFFPFFPFCCVCFFVQQFASSIVCMHAFWALCFCSVTVKFRWPSATAQEGANAPPLSIFGRYSQQQERASER